MLTREYSQRVRQVWQTSGGPAARRRFLLAMGERGGQSYDYDEY